jgi:hypothetical protein
MLVCFVENSFFVFSAPRPDPAMIWFPTKSRFTRGKHILSQEFRAEKIMRKMNSLYITRSGFIHFAGSPLQTFFFGTGVCETLQMLDAMRSWFSKKQPECQ